MNALSLYPQLPIPIQNIACSFEGWRIRRDRYNQRFFRILEEMERRTWWSQAGVEGFRDVRLAAMVVRAAQTSDFYRERFRAAGIDPRNVGSLADLAALPVIRKADVKRFQGEVRLDGIPASELRTVHTSGTTGSGLRFLSTAGALQAKWAVWWRYRRWHGIRLDTWCGYFGGRVVVPAEQSYAPYWRVNSAGRQILFSVYHLSERTVRAYLDELRRRQPPWLHGYPSALGALAGFMVQAGLELGYPLRWVTVGAETLLPYQRRLMERAFGVPPRQHYGMAETTANFSECELGRLHVDEDFAAVEFEPDPCGGWEVIGTNLTNAALPLVRYAAGDRVTLAAEPCTCGRPGRIVESIDGRIDDSVVLPNGARLGRLNLAFIKLTRIHEAQIHQRRIGEITVRVVRGPGYTDADEALLREELTLRIGTDTVIRIEYFDSLERTRTGKLRSVVSELQEARAGAG